MTTPKIRLVLARRLARLMDSTPALDTQQKLAAASGLAQSTIGRILRADVALSIDNLESIARAFSIAPCDLLHEGAKREVSLFDAEQYQSLPDAGKERIASFVRWTLNEYAKTNRDSLTFAKEDELRPHERAAAIRAATREPAHETTTGEAEPARRRRGRPRKISW